MAQVDVANGWLRAYAPDLDELVDPAPHPIETGALNASLCFGDSR